MGESRIRGWPIEPALPRPTRRSCNNVAQSGVEPSKDRDHHQAFAQNGDSHSDRYVARTRALDRPVNFALPKLETAADAVKATAAVANAVASGELTPMEAGEMAKLVEGFTRAFEIYDIDKRLSLLETERGGS